MDSGTVICSRCGHQSLVDDAGETHFGCGGTFTPATQVGAPREVPEEAPSGDLPAEPILDAEATETRVYGEVEGPPEEAESPSGDDPETTIAPDDVQWARGGSETSWHEVQREIRGGIVTWCGRTLISPSRRDDLGSGKSCESCYRRRTHAQDR